MHHGVGRENLPTQSDGNTSMCVREVAFAIAPMVDIVIAHTTSRHLKIIVRQACGRERHDIIAAQRLKDMLLSPHSFKRLRVVCNEAPWYHAS